MTLKGPFQPKTFSDSMFQAGPVEFPGLFYTLSNVFQRSICYSVGKEVSPFGLNTQVTALPEATNYMGQSSNKDQIYIYAGPGKYMRAFRFQ